jgi:maleylacetoacetate isomerase
MKLYSFHRSSASYRVRIALNLKGIDHELVPVHLQRGGGEHRQAAYRAVNPQGRVPALQLDDGRVLHQSMAIMEYLEATIPQPALLPGDPVQQARIRAVAQMVVADIHPLDNTSVLKYLNQRLGQDAATVQEWYVHWIVEGFTAIEALVEGPHFCFGGVPTLADVCLMPQARNAIVNKVDMTPYPKIAAIYEHCAKHPAFVRAHPDNQPDADPSMREGLPGVR